MAEFAAKYAIAKDNQHIIIGRAENEIHSLSEDINAGLIVVGSSMMLINLLCRAAGELLITRYSCATH